MTNFIANNFENYIEIRTVTREIATHNADYPNNFALKMRLDAGGSLSGSSDLHINKDSSVFDSFDVHGKSHKTR